MAAVQDQQAEAETNPSINYRYSLPGAPRPVCQSLDDPPSDLHDTMAKHDEADQAPQLPPVLPRRSELRTSKMLDTMSLKLDEARHSTLSQASAPHEVYLSSEEDASSSAGDFSENGSDSDAEAPEERTSRKRSYEDTARAVEVVFAGKPTMVTVRRSGSSRNPARTSTFPLATRGAEQPPKRHNTQPAFLDTDPYNEPKASVLQKTIGLVRKRSRPLLNLSNISQSPLGNSADNYSTASLVTPSSTTTEPGEDASGGRRRAPSMPPVKTEGGGPVTYQDIMRNVRRNEAGSPRSPVAGSPVMPSKKSSILGGLSMGKRRSVRA